MPSNRPNKSSRTSFGDAWGQTGKLRAQTTLPEELPHDAALPGIAAGALYVLRQFDIADEVDLTRAQALLVSTQRSPLVKPRASALVLSNPPLTAPLGRRSLSLEGQAVEADLVAKIFDFGAVSIRMRIQIPPGASWKEMSALAAAAQSDESLTRIAREATDALVQQLGDAIDGLHEKPIFEDYVVASIERFDPPTPASSLPLDAVARLLLGESPDATLSASEIRESTRNRSSYYGEDLCVSGWNCALVVDPSGDLGTVEVLELANAQLLELRYYDELLDRELSVLYDEIARRRGRGPAILRSYGPVLRRAMVVMLEIAEFIERVENSLKIIGDVYLARVYASGVDALRIQAWERSVTRKHDLVQQVYDVLKSEVDASRGQLLELAIVALIVGDIVMAFF